MIKLIIIVISLLMVSAHAVEILEGQQNNADQIKGNLLETIEILTRQNHELTGQNHELTGQNHELTGSLFKYQVCFWVILTVLSGFCLMHWRNQLLIDHTKENQPPPTEDKKLTYIELPTIGTGNSGTSVHTGTYDGHQRAIKRLLNTHYKIAENEKNLLLKLNHRNIVRCYGYEKNEYFTFIILEQCACSLQTFIKTFLDVNAVGRKMEFLSCLKKKFHLWQPDGNPSKYLIELIKGIVNGLEFLHNNKIIHCDLKPSNVLIFFDLEKEAVPKLSDMGMSKNLMDKSHVSPHGSYIGTSGWKAPKLLLNGRYDACIDMFTLGCLIFFLLSKGGHPFGDETERVENIRKNKSDLTIIGHMPEAKHLITN